MSELQAEQVDSTTVDTPSSPEVSSTDTNPIDSSNQTQTEQVISELEKMGKFKFQGKEWTPKDLEKAILRQQDYTKKTQALSKDKESVEQDRKFYENLYYDLQRVASNPNEWAAKFIQVYPEKFHGYLKQILGQSNQTQNSQQQQTQNQQAPLDVETMSRLNKLEKFYNDQETSKNTQEINSQVELLSKKYPDAIPEMVIGRIYDAINRGVQYDKAMWEQTFEAVDKQMKDLVKSRYGDLVKKQTEANKKAADVSSGGGAVGRAPPKFNSLKDVTNFAINDLTKRG